MRFYKKGEIICKEGDISKMFYVLLGGKAGVYKKGVKVAEFTEKGTVFGELSAVLGIPRSADIIADEICQVLELEYDFDDLLKTNPNVLKKIIAALASRLNATTEKYAELCKKINKSCEDSDYN